jgi:cytochrome c-type biogenesis protein CcmE
MTRKQRRGAMIGGGVAILVVASLLVMVALRDKIVFFHSPSDVVEKKVPVGQRFRLGGLVQTGSIKREGVSVEFAVTDTIRTLPVVYAGILPDLFREGQGVVTEGKIDQTGRFIADTVLAKHDENYMPPEAAKALKDKGVTLGKSATHKGPTGPAPEPVKVN